MFSPVSIPKGVSLDLSAERLDIAGYIDTQDRDQITKIDPVQGTMNSLHWVATVQHASIVADAPLILGFPAVR